MQFEKITRKLAQTFTELSQLCTEQLELVRERV